jgi:hypothetical protein
MEFTYYESTRASSIDMDLEIPNDCCEALEDRVVPDTCPGILLLSIGLSFLLEPDLYSQIV